MASAEAEPAWLWSGRIPALDGLRAIAVGLVLLAHAHQTRGFPELPVLHAIGRKGGVGVEIFFVISGFLITTLILRERDRTGRLALGPFYLRRILRIVPVYVCFLLVVAILQVLSLVQLRGRDWFAAATYTVNFLLSPAWEIGHAWSLSIEEHFYLVWPFLLSLAPQLGLRVAATCMALCFAARWAVMITSPSLTPMAELWTFTRLDSIATGCLLAFLARDEAWRRRLDLACRGIGPVTAILALLLGSLSASGYSAKFSVGIGYSLNSMCIAMLMWTAMRSGGTWLGRVLDHWALVSVGVTSYSLYLWQQLFLNPRNDGILCTFPINLALAVIVAYSSYYLIERPFLRLKAGIVPAIAPPERS